MKVTVVFVRVVTKPEYNSGARRWACTYHGRESGYKHDLVIINRYADALDDLLPTHKKTYLRYDGGGWDVGSWQFAGKNIDTDLLVCFNSSTYVTDDGWLKRFVDAVEANGDGLYGPMSSRYISPHIRTPCMIFQPHVINGYPKEVKNREDTYRFEVFGWPDETPNFTQWVIKQGFKAMTVHWDGEYDLMNWRTPPNIFRRGDQSNLIVRDRHADAYEASDTKNKANLEKMADGL